MSFDISVDSRSRTFRKMDLYLRQVRALEENNDIRIDSTLRDMSNPMEAFSDRKFKEKFRFSKDTVRNMLLPLVYESLKAKHGRSHPPIMQMLITLRYLASNSFQDVVADTTKCSQPTVSTVVAKVARLFAGMRERFIKFPSHHESHEIKHNFFAISGFQGSCSLQFDNHIFCIL
jgi:hypothetical protein